MKGYKAQSELVMAHLARMVEGCAARGESAVVEGVHLNLRLLAPLMARHAAVLPFLTGCQNVKPWQRGTLADYTMRQDRDWAGDGLNDHIWFSRETADGGKGVGAFRGAFGYRR